MFFVHLLSQPQQERLIADERILQDQQIADERLEEDRRIADERAQDAALEAYLEQMSTLLLGNKLRKSVKGAEVRDVARAWTLTVLRRLKAERKGILLRFLYESGLSKYSKGI